MINHNTVSVYKDPFSGKLFEQSPDISFNVFMRYRNCYRKLKFTSQNAQVAIDYFRSMAVGKGDVKYLYVNESKIFREVGTIDRSRFKRGRSAKYPSVSRTVKYIPKYLSDAVRKRIDSFLLHPELVNLKYNTSIQLALCEFLERSDDELITFYRKYSEELKEYKELSRFKEIESKHTNELKIIENSCDIL